MDSILVSNAALMSGYRLHSLNVSIETRRGRRNGDDARVKTSEKRFDVSESRRVQEEGPLATRACFLHACSNRASTQVQLSVSDARLTGLAVAEEAISYAVGRRRRPLLKQFDERGNCDVG